MAEKHAMVTGFWWSLILVVRGRAGGASFEHLQAACRRQLHYRDRPPHQPVLVVDLLNATDPEGLASTVSIARLQADDPAGSDAT
jgi:hypothetical protein